MLCSWGLDTVLGSWGGAKARGSGLTSAAISSGTEAQPPNTFASRTPLQGPGGSLECGHVLTPFRVKCSVWGLLAFAEDNTHPRAKCTGLSHAAVLLGQILHQGLVSLKLLDPLCALYHLQLARQGRVLGGSHPQGGPLWESACNWGLSLQGVGTSEWKEPSSGPRPGLTSGFYYETRMSFSHLHNRKVVPPSRWKGNNGI